MMRDDLAPWSMGELGEQAFAAALAALLALTYDAVVLFDKSGGILLANDEAERLFRSEGGHLVGTNVRRVFPPPATVPAMDGPLEGSLPFPLDGSTAFVTCEASDHAHLSLLVRCSRLRIPGTHAYVLVAHQDDAAAEQASKTPLVEELSRANRRLSGTLKIVLGTLDSLDVGTLFSRVLNEIADTMDAWGTLAYVAESGGYRLRGRTETLENVPTPAFMGHGSPLVDLASRVGQSTCIRVSPPSRSQLRQGETGERTFVDERTGAALTAEASVLPPFASFVLMPVWFGGHMIALLEVGWRHTHRLRDDDMRLLDAVSEYLSVQLAGAFAALRAQHADILESLGTKLRERMLAQAQLTPEVLGSLMEDAAKGIDAALVPLRGNTYQRITMGLVPELGETNVPVDLDALVRSNRAPGVEPLEDHPELLAWVTANTEYGQGVLAALCVMDSSPYGCLLLRHAEDEPFEDVDLTFVRRLAEDVREVMEGERARSRDKHIAQALQRGMRNELQSIDGLSAQSCYSSATEAALVGGDFYDLIRLPERRACVIMGDVSGKGVEAASVSSAVKTALGAYSWEGLRPARMVSLLNDFLLGFSRIETFATLFVGMIDLSSHTLTYCSAGHPPALLVRAQSGELVTLSTQSGVVGAFPEMTYRDGEVRLGAGDILVLYTDGVTEARNPGGAFFDEEGLRESVLRQVSLGFDGLCDRVLEDVRSFSGQSLEDDVALVCVQVDEDDANEGRKSFWGTGR